MKKIGHRGAAGHAPENTLAAFRKGLELGVDLLECDLRLVQGELVIFHDETLDRCTKVKGKVSETELSKLRSLDAGAGERIPVLDELFELAAGKCGLVLEIKEVGLADALYKKINTHTSGAWSWDDITVISFFHSELVRIKQLKPNVRTGALVVGLPINFPEYCKANGFDLCDMQYSYVSSEFVDKCHRLGLQAWVFTPNDKADIAALRKMGIDGIASDYPDLL